MRVSPEPRTEDWYPSGALALTWNVLGLLLAVVGLVLFAAVYLLAHGGFDAGMNGTATLPGIFILMLIFTFLLVAHEWLHGLTMKRYGAHPEYRAGLLKKAIPYLGCTSPGHEFTRTQFAAVSAAPLVVVSLLGALCVAFVPLGGCIGDIWFLGIIARLPRGTILEDLTTGVRFISPTT